MTGCILTGAAVAAVGGVVVFYAVRRWAARLAPLEGELARVHAAAELERQQTLADIAERAVELEWINAIPDTRERLARLARYVNERRR